MVTGAGGGARAAERRARGEVVRLAWPAVLSYVLHNSYRINDQFWVQGLGAPAQAAIGAAFFVCVLNFAVVFLAAGGTMALVARAVGAGDRARADSITRHALLFAGVIALGLGLVGTALTDELVGLLGLGDQPVAAAHARDYLGTLYALILPMVLVPVLDNAFIGRGNTKVPMCLDLLAIGFNWVLNPLLIYGGGAVEAMGGSAAAPPGAALADALARAAGAPALGMSGAALATCLSRAGTSALGLLVLRAGYGMSLAGGRRPRLSSLAAIARISAPVSASIAVYAAVYLALFGLVLRPMSPAVKAGLGLGFQVFEGVSFPCYLGVAVAGASLVGRRLGAGDREGALAVVRATRFAGRCVAIAATAVFLGAGRPLAELFTQDPEVLRETVLYVTILAASQYWVAVESVNEKVLLGSGDTAPILLVSGLGNALRIPLAWLLAVELDLGAAGVWWAIDATTWLKAGCLWRIVQRGRWTDHLAERGAARA